MKRILLPLEETERSLKALQYVKKNFTPAEAELVLMMVDERLGYSIKSEAEAAAISEMESRLDAIAATLEGYKIIRIAATGKAGLKITRAVRETGSDLIVMTKSSKADMLGSLGSTAEYVINNSACDVMIVSEQAARRNEYRGLIYRTARGTVTLRGQLGTKQSECLLPSVNQDCIYHIEMTVGKVRFFHTAYNPDTRNWDQMPLPGQEVTMDIVAGESKDILVKADSTEGKADRIRIVNRDMKKEAVFSFRITAASSAEKGEPAAEETAPEDPVCENDGPLSAEAEAIMNGTTAAEEAMARRSTIEIPKTDFPDNFEEPAVPDFEPAENHEAAESVEAAYLEPAAESAADAVEVPYSEPAAEPAAEAADALYFEPAETQTAFEVSSDAPSEDHTVPEAFDYEPVQKHAASAVQAETEMASASDMPLYAADAVTSAETEADFENELFSAFNTSAEAEAQSAEQAPESDFEAELFAAFGTSAEAEPQNAGPAPTSEAAAVYETSFTYDEVPAAAHEDAPIYEPAVSFESAQSYEPAASPDASATYEPAAFEPAPSYEPAAEPEAPAMDFEAELFAAFGASAEAEPQNAEPATAPEAAAVYEPAFTFEPAAADTAAIYEPAAFESALSHEPAAEEATSDNHAAEEIHNGEIEAEETESSAMSLSKAGVLYTIEI